MPNVYARQTCLAEPKKKAINGLATYIYNYTDMTQQDNNHAFANTDHTIFLIIYNISMLRIHYSI